MRVTVRTGGGPVVVCGGATAEKVVCDSTGGKVVGPVGPVGATEPAGVVEVEPVFVRTPLLVLVLGVVEAPVPGDGTPVVTIEITVVVMMV